VVLDLYERRWAGRRLHPGDDVISSDEKTQLQALLRRHALVAPAAGRSGLVEHGYRRPRDAGRPGRDGCPRPRALLDRLARSWTTSISAADSRRPRERTCVSRY
jgi:hypothetical protein